MTMRLRIITTEKIQNKFAKEAVAEYSKRLNKYCKIELKTTKSVDKEIRERDYVIKIDKEGQSISSEQLAGRLSLLGVSGTSDIVVVLDDGYDTAKSDFNLNISIMDINSDLMLVILYEQIYRAFRIIHNEPYHK